MKLHFWGTRGSIPTPSTSSIPTQEFGGDTTCLSLDWGKENLLILDAGSGLRQAGLEWAAQGRRAFTFFLPTPTGIIYKVSLFSRPPFDRVPRSPSTPPAFPVLMRAT